MKTSHSASSISSTLSTTSKEAENPFKFPSLNTPDLSDDARDVLKGRLMQDVFDIQKTFQTLQTDTMDSFQKRELPGSKLILRLNQFIAVPPMRPTHKSANLSESLQDAQTTDCGVEDVFNIMVPYISFFNYELLGYLIQQLGDADDKSRLEIYKKSFEQFCQRRVCECPQFNISQYDKLEGETTIEVKIKDEFQHLTMHGVCLFKKNLCEILQARKEVLRFISVEEGCVKLVFLLNTSTVKHSCTITDLTDQQLHTLIHAGVTCFMVSYSITQLHTITVSQYNYSISYL